MHLLLQVGDIIQVDKDKFFPADLLLLAVPESVEGIAYVETINLDGESNLKIKKALDETQHLKLDTLKDFTVSPVVLGSQRLLSSSKAYTWLHADALLAIHGQLLSASSASS